jgi:hypothetical protein
MKSGMNKKAMSIAIILLVVLTLILVTLSITYFILRERNLRETIHIPSELDALYARESEINFQLKRVFERATENFRREQGKDIFIRNFNSELDRYRESALSGVLSQIEIQLNPENVILTDESLILELDIQLTTSKSIKGREILDIDYNYTKRFEKIFKVESA